ncbi:MAG: TRAP transporter large permease subunit [Acidobacteriota bacterium]|jgi:tripartite ATP-independent transporter DctM subunit|nr:TRAP transporter large permease subunit [Acidobacteriota bacterium]
MPGLDRRTLLLKAENATAYISVALLALFPSLEVLVRKFFHSGVANSGLYTHHLVLATTFLGGMITARKNRHLALSLNFHLSETSKRVADTFVHCISVTFLTVFSWASISFAFNGFAPGQHIGPLPIWIPIMVMPLGFAVMAVRHGGHIPGKRLRPVAVLLAVITGTLIAAMEVGNAINTLLGTQTGFFSQLAQMVSPIVNALTLPLVLLLILAALYGAPIFIVLGGIATLLFAQAGQPLEVIPNEAYAMLISHSLPAIPLFTIAGFILSESRAGERLVQLFQSLFSWIPGGLALMSVLVCSFFTTFTGASGVTILALGALLAYVLNQGGYGKRFNQGLLTASGSVGLLFPPSLPIIIYGVAAGVSIRDMFVGGIIPGVVMISALAVFGIVYARRNHVPRERFALKPALRAVGVSLGEILLPVAILLAFFGGLTTLVESSALAVVYAFVLEFLIHRDLKIRDLGRVLEKSLPIIGGVLIILALAKGLSYYIVDAEVPLALTHWVEAHIGSKYVFLLILNIVLLATGCLMDIFSAIMVVVPLILPLGELFGIHPVHLGIIFLANMELGYLTPPVGLNLFLASYRFNEPLARIYRNVIPFFLIQLLTVLLITYLPFLSTALLK